MMWFAVSKVALTVDKTIAELFEIEVCVLVLNFNTQKSL